MEKQYEMPPSAKLSEFYSEFQKAHEKDVKAGPGTVVNFESLVKGILFECFELVKKKQPGKLPSLQVKFLNQKEFDALCLGLGISSGSSYAFTEHTRGIIGVNVEALMAKGLQLFFTNLVITFFEELFHATDRHLGEVSTKKLAYEATESYLDIIIPQEYKEASYERAADPSYGK